MDDKQSAHARSEQMIGQLLEQFDQSKSAFDDVIWLFEAVVADMAETKRVAGQPPISDFWRRILVRNALAGCEGMLWGLKQCARISKASFSPALSQIEQAYLSDEAFVLGEKGEVKSQSAKISLINNIKFTAKILGRMENSGFQLNTSGEGFRQFTVAINVRDRITHPKKALDFKISDDEMVATFSGVYWLSSEWQEFIRLRRAAVQPFREKQIDVIRTQLKEIGATEAAIQEFTDKLLGAAREL